MTRRRSTTCLVAASLMLAGTATLTSSAPADAAPRGNPGIVWEPYRSGPISYDHGECPFPVDGTPVVDREQKATLATYPDGSPKLELYRGALKVRFTNTTTNRSRVVDISGRGALQYRPDGSQIFFMDGPVAVGIRPTDHYKTGLWRFDGIHVLYSAPDRADRRVLLDRGTEQNICHLID